MTERGTRPEDSAHALRTKNTDVLRELSKSPDRLVRMRVASNPRTPIDVLKELGKDPDPLVSATARDTEGMGR